MYVIRYEKESLNEYIIYRVENETFINLLLNNNHFYGAYPNDQNQKIRFHFKLILTNKNIMFYMYDILTYINEQFKSEDDDWTIIINEKILNDNHLIYLYFYSKKYYSTLKDLKRIINTLHFEDVLFDDSIYYKSNSKYKDFIELILPNQIYKKSSFYKLYMGSYDSINILDTHNLVNCDFYDYSS